MQVENDNKILRPIVKAPTHNFDGFKTPTQQSLEFEHGISNKQAQQISKQSTSKVYESMKKLVENTDYSISYNVSESTGSKQFRITMKNSGTKVAEFPHDAAVQIAEKARFDIQGLFVDEYL